MIPIPPGFRRFVALPPNFDRKPHASEVEIEKFIDGFSSYNVFGHPSTRIGCIDDPKAAAAIRECKANADEGLQISLSNLLGEKLSSPVDAPIFFLIAEERYRSKRNPLWPLFVFYAYAHAGLPPPKWVWGYFSRASALAAQGAAELLPMAQDKKIQRNPVYTVDALQKAMGLVIPRGKKDYFTEFQKDVTDLRLALRVRNLGFAGKFRHGWLTTACRKVADEVRSTKKRGLERQAKNKATQVQKAYRRWFEKDGCLSIRPRQRDPYNSGKHLDFTEVFGR